MTGRQDWLAMPPVAFDAAAPDQPLALFPPPDVCGTPDLFDAQED